MKRWRWRWRWRLSWSGPIGASHSLRCLWRQKATVPAGRYLSPSTCEYSYMHRGLCARLLAGGRGSRTLTDRRKHRAQPPRLNLKRTLTSQARQMRYPRLPCGLASHQPSRASVPAGDQSPGRCRIAPVFVALPMPSLRRHLARRLSPVGWPRRTTVLHQTAD